MHARVLASFGVRAIALTMLSLTAGMVSAQTPRPRSTSAATPDLQGIWISRSATPLERPKALDGRPLLSDVGSRR